MTEQHNIRTSLVFLLFGIVYCILLCNLYRIQIVNHAFYTQMGASQYYVTISQQAPRAPIFDRSGNQYLAMNKEAVSAFILPQKITHSSTLLPFLKKHFYKAYIRWEKEKKRSFLFIGRKLSPEKIKLIKDCNHPDIQLLHEPNRYYPCPSASPVIGTTDIDNQGLFGIELYHNENLRGNPTTYTLEKDARSGYFYFNKNAEINGQEGKPLLLTINSDLQFLAHEELMNSIKQYDAKEGGVIIMNPENGDILTMSCFPHYDPNGADTFDIETTKNRTITNSYELGSVMKVFAALAALEEGVVTPNELIDCKNSTSTFIDGRKINTVTAHGIIPFTDVVARSNNIGIALVAKRVGTKLYDHYKKIGFGQKTGISLPGEAKGFVNHPSNWSKQSLISLSYGYEISITLLQLACAFCMIAHNGHSVSPRIILDEPVKIGPQLYSDQTIATIQSILEQTTLRGTAVKAHIKGYTIMSKTGTANMLVDGIYDPKKNIYTCTGIVQKGNYKRVIAVFIKEANQEDLYASTVVAPLLERVAQRMIVCERAIF